MQDTSQDTSQDTPERYPNAPTTHPNDAAAQNPWAAPNATATFPAVRQGDIPTYVYPIIRVPGTVQGITSRFREGNIALSQEGISLQGLAVVKEATRIKLTLLGILAGAIGAAIVGTILEYVRSPYQEQFAWSEVSDIVLESQKNRIAFVYPDRDKPSRMCTLVLKYDPVTYQNIVQASRYFGSSKVREGKIKRPDIIALWVLLGLVALIFLIGIIASNSK